MTDIMKNYFGFYLVGMLVLTFGLTWLAGHFILPQLRAKHVGQMINEYAPETHKKKQGTPTMGGICFIFSFLLGMAGISIYALVSQTAFDFIPFALVICFAAGNAAIGVVDDWRKLAKKQNEGLKEWQKLVLQFAVAAGFIAMMAITGNLQTTLHIPFTDLAPDLGWFAYPLYLLVLVGFVNSTNLTDGVDGLASSVCALTALFMVFFSIRNGEYEVGFMSAALLGGVLGFLIYNFYPAKMFMGDTGALFLGGVIMGCAVMVGELLLFVLAGFVFVMDMLSVIIQRTYFKLTHGKRIFKKAPMHHHFEECGFSEVAVVGLFTSVSILFCVLAWMGQ